MGHTTYDVRRTSECDECDLRTRDAAATPCRPPSRRPCAATPSRTRWPSRTMPGMHEPARSSPPNRKLRGWRWCTPKRKQRPGLAGSRSQEAHSARPGHLRAFEPEAEDYCGAKLSVFQSLKVAQVAIGAAVASTRRLFISFLFGCGRIVSWRGDVVLSRQVALSSDDSSCHV